MLFSHMSATVFVLLLAVAACQDTGLPAERKLRGGFVPLSQVHMSHSPISRVD